MFFDIHNLPRPPVITPGRDPVTNDPMHPMHDPWISGPRPGHSGGSGSGGGDGKYFILACIALALVLAILNGLGSSSSEDTKNLNNEPSKLQCNFSYWSSNRPQRATRFDNSALRLIIQQSQNDSTCSGEIFFFSYSSPNFPHYDYNEFVFGAGTCARSGQIVLYEHDCRCMLTTARNTEYFDRCNAHGNSNVRRLRIIFFGEKKNDGTVVGRICYQACSQNETLSVPSFPQELPYCQRQTLFILRRELSEDCREKIPAYLF